MVGGLTFDSKREADRWQELLAEVKAGTISCLQRQKTFVVRVNGQAVCRYKADFVYVRGGVRVVEDVKSAFTAKDKVFRLKKKLVRAALGIEIREEIR